MAQRVIKSCGTCAYAQKEGSNLWCPFHDEPVNTRLVCDDHLDQFASPLYMSLAEENSKVGIGTIIKDAIAYILIGGFIIFTTIWTIGYLTQ